MAVTITNNRKNTSACIHVSSANANIVVAGNNSISTIAKEDEIITGASITQVFWGCDPNGYINIKRGGVLVATYDSTSYYDYAGTGMSLSVNKEQPIVVEFMGSSNCYVFFEVQKHGQFNNDPYLTAT